MTSSLITNNVYESEPCSSKRKKRIHLFERNNKSSKLGKFHLEKKCMFMNPIHKSCNECTTTHNANGSFTHLYYSTPVSRNEEGMFFYKNLNSEQIENLYVFSEMNSINGQVIRKNIPASCITLQEYLQDPNLLFSMIKSHITIMKQFFIIHKTYIHPKSLFDVAISKPLEGTTILLRPVRFVDISVEFLNDLSITILELIGIFGANKMENQSKSATKVKKFCSLMDHLKRPRGDLVCNENEQGQAHMCSHLLRYINEKNRDPSFMCYRVLLEMIKEYGEYTVENELNFKCYFRDQEKEFGIRESRLSQVRFYHEVFCCPYEFKRTDKWLSLLYTYIERVDIKMKI